MPADPPAAAPAGIPPASPAAAPAATPFPASRVLGFGLPLVAGMGGHALFNLVDLWIVGPLGPTALAALTVTSLVNGIAMVLLQGVTDGSVALISRAIGEKDAGRASEATRQAILLVLLLAVLLGVPPYLAARPLTAAFGASGIALDLGTDCLEIMSLGSITMFLMMQSGAALRAEGRSLAPAGLLMGANVINAFLAFGLVHGRFGLPAMGITGACWGTVIARGICAAAGLLLLARSPLALHWKGARLRWEYQKSLLLLGVPVAAQWLVRLVPVLLVLRLCGRIGTEAQAAFGIGSRLDQFAAFATIGWGAAAATATGQGLGARDPDGAARAAWRAALYGVIMMAVIGTFFAWRAGDLIPLVGRHDGASPSVVAFGAGYLRILAFGYPGLGVALVLSMALSGAGSVRLPLLLDSIFLVALFVPLALVLSPAAPGESLRPLWWVLAGVFDGLGIAYVVAFASGRWKRTAV